MLLLDYMLRLIVLLGTLVLTSCRFGDNNGHCATWTKCVPHDQAWCHAGRYIAVTAPDLSDGGILCQGGSMYVRFDAGTDGVCPTSDELSYELNGEYIVGNDTGSLIDDQCCYSVGGGCS